MTSTRPAAADLRPAPSSSRALRAATTLALLGGGALVVDTVTITVINRSFDPLDSVLFLAGLGATLGALAAFGLHVGAGRRGAARAGATLGTVVAAVAALGVLASVCDAVGRHVFSPANRGLHGEWSFFSVGVALLLLAAWTRRRGLT